MLRKEDILPIIFIILAILIGYHSVFLGGNIFTHQDSTLMSSYSYGNSIGNGWRPDKGFGMSFFYGDAKWHPWGFYSLWERLFSSAELAYTIPVVIVSIAGGISLYFLLRLIVPDVSRWIWLLCPLVIFAPHMSGLHYLRNGIVTVAAPLAVMVLYKYFKVSKIEYKYILFFALILWITFVFGSIKMMARVISLGFLFSFTYMLYHRLQFKKFILKLVMIYTLGLVSAFLLAFWIFYTSFVELSVTEYTRVKTLGSIAFNLDSFIPNLKKLISLVVGFFQIDWLPHDVGLGRLPGSSVLEIVHRSYNVMAAFPLLLVFFFFRQSRSFWEYSFKILVLLPIVHGLLSCFPLYQEILRFTVSNSKQLINMYGYPFSCQIGLIALFFFTLTEKDLMVPKKGMWILLKGFSIILFVLYSGLALFTLLAILIPGAIPDLLSWGSKTFVPVFISRYPEDYLGAVINNIISYMQTGFHWYSFVFYSLNAVFVLLFFKREWLVIFIKKPVFIASLLMINAIFMAWTVYPLNTKPLVWEAAQSEMPEFNPYGRFYYAGSGDDYKFPRTLKSYREKVTRFGGGVEYIKANYGIYGYEVSPVLNLHGHRSFAPKDETDYILRAFNYDGIERLENVRSLAKGPLVSSELLDMGAVSYYYTRQELLDVPEYLKLYFKASNGLSIYKNLNAWPYFYLAEQFGFKIEGKHLENVKPGTAYLAKEDFFPLHENAGNSSIELKEFSYGKMVFDFSGNNEEFLVIADAWHPFWKAYVGEKNLPIVKANEIFKGVRLPKGEYALTLEFDTSPYLPGVYVTIIFWILFLSAWFWVYSGSKHKRLVNVGIP